MKKHLIYIQHLPWIYYCVSGEEWIVNLKRIRKKTCNEKLRFFALRFFSLSVWMNTQQWEFGPQQNMLYFICSNINMMMSLFKQHKISVVILPTLSKCVIVCVCVLINQAASSGIFPLCCVICWKNKGCVNTIILLLSSKCFWLYCHPSMNCHWLH